MTDRTFTPTERPEAPELDAAAAAALEGCDPRHVFHGPGLVVGYRRTSTPAPEGSVVKNLIETDVILFRDGETKTAAVPINESFDVLIPSPKGQHVLARMKIGGIGHVYELDVDGWEPRLVITCKKTEDYDARYVGPIDYVDEDTVVVIVGSGKESHLALLKRQPGGHFEEVDNIKAKGTSLVCLGSVVATKADDKVTTYGVVAGSQLVKLGVTKLPAKFGGLRADPARERLYFLSQESAWEVHGLGAGLEKKKPKKPKKGTIVLRRILEHHRPQIALRAERIARFGEHGGTARALARTLGDWLLGDVPKTNVRLVSSPDGELRVTDEENPILYVDAHPREPARALARRGSKVLEVDLLTGSETVLGEREGSGPIWYLEIDGELFLGAATADGDVDILTSEMEPLMRVESGAEGYSHRVSLFGRGHLVHTTPGKDPKESVLTLLQLHHADGAITTREVGVLAFPGKRYNKLRMLPMTAGAEPYINVLGSEPFYFRV